MGFFGSQGQVTHNWNVWSGRNSNSSENLWLSWLPARWMKIPSKLVASIELCQIWAVSGHVGLFETYRYKRTGQFFIWNYIGNRYFFSKYLDNYCRYQYCANDTLFRNISSILRSIFQDILPKKDDNRHCPFLYKTDSKFFGNQCVYRCLKWSH